MLPDTGGARRTGHSPRPTLRSPPHWYGGAAGTMRAFYEAIEESIEKTPVHGHEDRVLPEFYTPSLMAELAKHMTAAEAYADTERARLFRVKVPASAKGRKVMLCARPETSIP